MYVSMANYRFFSGFIQMTSFFQCPNQTGFKNSVGILFLADHNNLIRTLIKIDLPETEPKNYRILISNYIGFHFFS